MELGHWVAGSQNVTQFHVYNVVQSQVKCNHESEEDEVGKRTVHCTDASIKLEA